MSLSPKRRPLSLQEDMMAYWKQRLDASCERKEGKSTDGCIAVEKAQEEQSQAEPR